MNTPIFKHLLPILLLLTSGLAEAAINLGFAPMSQSADALDIALVVSGLDDASAPSLSTYDLDINFDPSHLSFAGAAFGDPLLGKQLDLLDFGLNATAVEITGPGVMNVFELSLDTPEDLNSLQADSFVLATLSFNIRNTGISQLQIAVNAFDDAEANAMSPVVTSATIATVPVPSAVWLMISGLAVLLRKSR